MADRSTASELPGRPDVIESVLGSSRALVAVAARSLAEVADDVTLAQYRALVVIASRGPQRVASLAESLDVTPPTATRMCDRLVRKGLIERRPSDEDRREVTLTLTPTGMGLVAEVTRRRRTEIATILDRIPTEQLNQMVELFGLFARAAGEPADRNWTTDWAL